MSKGRNWVVLALVIAVAMSLAACKKGPTQDQLFEKAKQAQEESNFVGAIEAYQQIVKLFPKSPQAPQCQFMIGYLYANHLKNMDMARKAYQDFIHSYPEHELIKDAQWELDHLGKDVNEIEELNRMLGKDSAKEKSTAVR